MVNKAWNARKEHFPGVRYAIAMCSLKLRIQQKKVLLKFRSLGFKLRLLRLDLITLKLDAMLLGIDIMLDLDEAYSKCSGHVVSWVSALVAIRTRLRAKVLRTPALPVCVYWSRATAWRFMEAARITMVVLRGLTFELRRDRRRDARPGSVKMYRVPPARAWWLAVGPRLERGVRPQRSRQWRPSGPGFALAVLLLDEPAGWRETT